MPGCDVRDGLVEDARDLGGARREHGVELAGLLIELVGRAFGALVDVAAGKQLDPAKTKLLPDMPKNHWAYKEISELAGNGLLDGDPDGEFKGDRMMTRYEFASIVYRQMMAGRELSDRLVQEFEPELERIRIDVVARHKDGTSSIERVRVNKPADKNSK